MDGCMVCRIGAIGLGHWFLQLCAEIHNDSSVAIAKAAAADDYSMHQAVLGDFGVGKESYYKMGPGGEIPLELMQEVDLVYISTPNEYHAEQVMQALSAGKFVVVEKTLGVTKDEFMRVSDFIRKNGFEDKVFLHLHYVGRNIVSALPGLAGKFTNEHGRIQSFKAVFWEEDNDIDREMAGWLLKQKNGGIFMDAMHPYEILFYGLGADEVHIEDLQLHIVNEAYSTVYPSGVDVVARVRGANFAEDSAQGAIRIGKGFSKGYGERKMEFNFADSSTLYISFISYEYEKNRVQMPYWELISKANGREEVLDFGKPGSEDDSEGRTLVSSIVKLYNGGGPDLKLDEAIRIFGPQWEYQRMSVGMKPAAFKYR